MLVDYTGAIQGSLADLFLAAHDHIILTTDPNPNDGSVQTIAIEDTGSAVYLLVKTNRGWFRSPAFTAVS